nr:hydrogenase maturation nickel metallochaperone HypA [Schwartzia sp. (in: firmicutes)]
MHEFSLVSAVIDSLEDYSVQQGWGQVKKVTLRVGAMRQVIP